MQDMILRTKCDACGNEVEYGTPQLAWAFVTFKENSPYWPSQTRHYGPVCFAGFAPGFAEGGIAIAGNATINIINS